MNKSIKAGKIVVPKNTLLRPHEIDIAVVLSWTGKDVIFIAANNNFPTPDIVFDGLEWEIKSPTGSSRRTIENNLRIAIRQAHNIIIDLNRMKPPEEKHIRMIKERAKKLGKKYRIMIITKNKRIIKLF